MRRRRSLILMVVARWVLMCGLGGLVLAALALLSGVADRGDAQTRQMLLVAAAVLLSLPFILAPLVRRALGAGRGRSGAGARKTLLDEMRDHGEDAISRGEPGGGEPIPTLEPPRTSFPLTLVLVALYVLFAAALLAVVFAI